ncbi:MAG: hypothetical protein JKY46_08750 [Robiginitomaculum sp.]|nr:hypothetical protein [Robiginitomaculum sp.]
MAGSNGINTWVRVIVVFIAAGLVSVFIIKGDPELAKQNANNKVNTVAKIAKGMVGTTGEAVLDATLSVRTDSEVKITEDVVEDATVDIAEDAAVDIVEDAVEEVVGAAVDAVAPAIQDAAKIGEAELDENIEPVSEVMSDIEAQVEQVEPNADDVPVNEATVENSDE